MLLKLSDIFVNFAKEKLKEEDEQKLEKYKNAPFRAPMIIILVSHIQDHSKVPEIEQVMSTAAAAQNILLALIQKGLSRNEAYKIVQVAIATMVLFCSPHSRHINVTALERWPQMILRKHVYL